MSQGSFPHITVLPAGKASCSVCRNVFGGPMQFDKRGIKRHVQSSGHKRKLNTLADRPPSDQQSTRKHDSATQSSDITANWLLADIPTSCSIEAAPTISNHLSGDVLTSETTSHDQTEPASTSDMYQHVDNKPADDNMPELESDSEWETDSDTDSDNSNKGLSCRGRRVCAIPTVPGRSQYGTQNVGVEEENWEPYGTKTMFLAISLFTLPCMTFSCRHIKGVLDFACESGAANVPSYYALRKTQQRLKSIMGNPTAQHCAPSGTVYYVNNIAESIQQDMSNPYVWPKMSFYPHMDGKQMTQAWNGHKMVHSLDDSLSTELQGAFFPFGGLSLGQQGSYAQLDTLYLRRQVNKDGLHVHTNQRIVVQATTFLENFPEYIAQAGHPVFDYALSSFQSYMPHSLRSLAGTCLVYSIPLIVFMDDALGNTSKQWNKHWSCYLSNAALQREALQLEYNVRSAFDHPIAAFDCVSSQEVLVWPFALFWAGDNPMQADHCSGSGTNNYKQSTEGYPLLFKSGKKRTAITTRAILDKRLEMAIKPKMIQEIKLHTQKSGIKDSVTQPFIDQLIDLRKTLQLPDKNGIYRSSKEIDSILEQELNKIKGGLYINPLLDMPGVDIHCNTPTELLHTILLGVVKYFWAQTVYIIERGKNMDNLESRLALFPVCGLNINNIPAHYICQYQGSLIGKHFKMLVQVMAFAVFDLLPENQDIVCAWLLLGCLTLLLWYTEIENIREYTAELQALIDDFLLITAQCSPAILILKPKFHFLVHLPYYIRRFGPALLFSTERFESFNGVFRAASTFSNRQSPLHDIAERFAQLDCAKHICAGGYWKQGNCWVRAGGALLRFVSTNAAFAPIFRIPKQKTWIP
ncbi:hypothetical protein RHS04_06690, partial [Rhizoctonia solani]